jgi:hypothetical protein
MQFKRLSRLFTLLALAVIFAAPAILRATDPLPLPPPPSPLGPGACGPSIIIC